jgi:hypothetical protein
MHACGKRKAKRPKNGDGWRIERSHMPEGKRKRRVKSVRSRLCAPNRVRGGTRNRACVGEGSQHCPDCKR